VDKSVPRPGGLSLHETFGWQWRSSKRKDEEENPPKKKFIETMLLLWKRKTIVLSRGSHPELGRTC